MELKIISQDGKINHIALAGRLDIAGEQAIRNELLSELVPMKKHLLVDMTAVSFLGSMGLGLLFQCAKTLRIDGAKMVAVNPQPMIAKVLEGSGVSEIIQIAADINKAKKILK